MYASTFIVLALFAIVFVNGASLVEKGNSD
jgi:hypothetical protein